MSNEIEKKSIEIGNRGLALRNLEDMYRFAQHVANSGLAPKSFVRPEQIMIAIQMGAELGMPPMKSLQSFAVVNGQARLWGDVPLALVRQSGNLEYIKESIEGDSDDSMYAICITKRKGDPEPKTTKFSVADAKKAGLWGKAGTWQSYPKRMLQYRARSFNLRDNFPDCFGGATIAEEYEGIEYIESTVIDKPRSAVLLEEPKETLESSNQLKSKKRTKKPKTSTTATIAEPTTTPEPENSPQEPELESPEEREFKYICTRCNTQYVVKPVNCLNCHGEVKEIKDENSKQES